MMASGRSCRCAMIKNRRRHHRYGQKLNKVILHISLAVSVGPVFKWFVNPNHTLLVLSVFRSHRCCKTTTYRTSYLVLHWSLITKSLRFMTGALYQWTGWNKTQSCFEVLLFTSAGNYCLSWPSVGSWADYPDNLHLIFNLHTPGPDLTSQLRLAGVILMLCSWWCLHVYMCSVRGVHHQSPDSVSVKLIWYHAVHVCSVSSNKMVPYSGQISFKVYRSIKDTF